MGNVKSKHTEREVLEEKRKYMRMTRSERRANCCRYKPLDAIPTWHDYFLDYICPRVNEVNGHQSHAVNDNINSRVSLYHGDITELEVDAIVNPACKSSNPTRGGLVNLAILEKAGQYFLDECINEGLYPVGSARIVGGYRLPAKHVINVFVPKGKEESILKACYEQALSVAKENNMRTLAFPCLGTHKKKPFSLAHSAQIAVSTVRKWMNDNHREIDRLVFCVFQSESLVHYNWIMQEYFPVNVSSKSLINPAKQPLTSAASGTRTSPNTTVPKDHLDARKRIILQEKKEYLEMSLTEKRQQYKVNKFVDLREITPWLRYSESKTIRVVNSNPFPVKDVLNCRVAFWKGDICELEIDAIVNSTVGSSMSGGVNTAVLTNAGNTYKEECKMQGYTKPGVAMVTGGYRLPAKYVINVCPPHTDQEHVLAQCYISCLDIAAQEGIKTMAFPCIATQKSFSFPPEKAAKLALQCVRNWLESNYSKVDLIIFCVYQDTHLEVYEREMQYYFPLRSFIPDESLWFRRGRDRTVYYK